MKYKIFISIFLLTAFFSFEAIAQNKDSSEFGNNDITDTTLTEQDEFTEGDSSNDEFSSKDSGSNEFEQVEDTDKMSSMTDENEKVSYNRLHWAIAILLYTILAGILIKFKATRNLRGLFLVIGLVILGFYRGGPGVISSFQNTYLLILGVKVNWQAAVLFVGLIPVTYLFGKVFCGWVCYLGAIQEFLYLGKVKILQSEKAQKVMKIIRIVAISVLLIQLTFTKLILFDQIGPFKTAINLFSPNITGYILLGIILVSSVFIYRPFCKTICPVGLVHGFVSKIPGASVLGINNSCGGCKTCNTSCQINAITRDGKTSKLDNEECIRCGDCLDDCNVSSMSVYSKSKEHKDKIILKGIKKLNLKK